MTKKEDEENTVEVLARHGRKSVVRRVVGSESSIRVIAPVKEGEPLNESDELFQLEARPGESNKYNVKPIYAGKSGPARVSNTDYRKGWDSIFGNKKKAKELN